MKITEVSIVPVRPRDGLVAFASCVVDGVLYLGSIAVHMRRDGSYRLVFPAKKVGETNLSIFKPIDKSFGDELSRVIGDECHRVFRRSDEGVRDDRHGTVDF